MIHAGSNGNKPAAAGSGRRLVYTQQIVMRPDILNPLFAEVTALKGVGPALAKPLDRLGLARVVDVALHLPTGWIDRVARDELSASDAGRTIAITLTPRDHRVSRGRGPDAGAGERRARQPCQPGLFRRRFRLREEAAADWRGTARVGQARAIWPGIADHPPGSGRGGRAVPRARTDLCLVGRTDFPPYRRAGGAGHRARAGAARVDRAGAEGEA